MAEKPDEQLLREKLTARLDENRALLQDALNGNLSADVVQRPLTSGGVRLCLVFLDGMAGRGDIDRFILEPCQRRVSPLPEGEARADELTESVLCVDDAEKIALLGEAVEDVLFETEEDGLCAGYTPRYVRVRADGRPGSVQKVLITSTEGALAVGRVVE